MRHSSKLTAGAAIALALVAAGPAAAQSERRGQTWASIAELPDLGGGVWEITGGGAFATPPPELTPEHAARAEAYAAAQARGEIEDTPTANCVPPGVPVVMWEPYPLEFLVTPGKVTIMIEAYSQWRQIFTDGRELPEDPAPAYNGHSVGHWEGDTLVVETVGISTDTPLGRNYGARHSEQMRMVERIRLTEPDLLEIQATVYDPVALEEPWQFTKEYARHGDWTLTEYICQENNRNATTADGKAVIDLEFEPGD